MKIALVCPYDFAYPGGVVNHVLSLERYFTRRGQEVKVIAPASKPVSVLGDRFVPVGKPRPVPANSSVVRINLSVNLSPRIKGMLDREKFDIIHLHEPLMPMLCTTVLRFSNSVNIGTFHANYKRTKYALGRPLDGYNFGRPFTTLFLKRRARKLDGRIAVSEPAREFAAKYLPGDYNIIPNGVDLERFSPEVPAIDEFRDEKVNILFVGRLEKRKGLKYLLEAYKQVKLRHANCRLIVVGPGSRLRRKYENQVIEEGIKDVVFAGQVAHNDLPGFYRTADIFCAPAIRCESFGLVLLEAMAAGKPIIASDIEGYSNLITRGVDGLLVPPKNEEVLAQTLVSLINDESLQRQMGASGRLKAQNYGWEGIAQRVFDYYIQVLNNTPGKRQLLEFKATSPV